MRIYNDEVKIKMDEETQISKLTVIDENDNSLVTWEYCPIKFKLKDDNKTLEIIIGKIND